jgi:hypothetical protein
LFKYIIRVIAIGHEFNWNKLAIEILRSTNKDFISSLLNKVVTDCSWNLNQIAGKALRLGSKDLFDYVRSL